MRRQELHLYVKRIKSEIPRLYTWNQDIWLHHIIGNLNEDIPGVDPQHYTYGIKIFGWILFITIRIHHWRITMHTPS